MKKNYAEEESVRGVPYQIIHRAALESSRDAILASNHEGYTLDYNQQFLELWGVTHAIMSQDIPSPGIDLALEKLVYPENFLKPVFHGKEYQNLNTYDLHEFKDGRIIERYTRPLKLNGEYLGRVWFFHDITEKEQAKEELEKSHANLLTRTYELDQFIYSASHDLKAPINSLMGLVNLLKLETQNEKGTHLIGLMDKSLQKLEAYIRNLAEFSENQSLEIGVHQVDFEEIVRETIRGLQSLQPERKIEFQIEINPYADFRSDPVRIRIILNNLISNAIKYHNPEREDAKVSISVNVEAQQAHIKIADNGIGIDPVHQSKVFDLFFRATYQSFGSGLGLYVTQNVVNKLQGKITLTSDLGSGTMFEVTLPNMTT